MENAIANTPANDVDAKVESLLTQFSWELAKKTGVSNESGAVESIVSKIRWYQNKAGAVVIVARGANRQVLATISPKKGDWTHLYPSWAAVLAELEERKIANGVSRMSHEGLLTGAIPEVKVLAE